MEVGGPAAVKKKNKRGKRSQEATNRRVCNGAQKKLERRVAQEVREERAKEIERIKEELRRKLQDKKFIYRDGDGRGASAATASDAAGSADRIDCPDADFGAAESGHESETSGEGAGDCQSDG